MTDPRPRLIIVAPDGTLDTPAWAEALSERFRVDLVGSMDVSALPEDLTAEDLVVMPGAAAGARAGLAEMASVISRVAEGVALVNENGAIAWQDDRFSAYSEDIHAIFVEHCLKAMSLFNQKSELDTAWPERHSREFSFVSGQRHFELLVSAAGVDPNDISLVNRVVGVLWENTATRRMQDRIDAIDAAGADLMAIDAGAMRSLSLPGRLKFLEERISHHVRNVLNFDDFEIRLIDRQSNRLDLVMSEGLTPLKIGEVIHADAEGNGISGHVAATGESYVCADVSQDPLYREGLDNAASSLTVPLRINSKIIGVFNIESNTKDTFDDNDRVFAELFGRYIAMAMNIFEIMVTERTSTSQEASQNMRGELVEPIKIIKKTARQLRKMVPADREVRAKINDIIRTAETITDRIDSCVAGPKTILEAEKELHRHSTDPAMRGSRVVIADDEPAIREGLEMILTQRGCEVVVVKNGLECIEILKKFKKRGERVDVVLSDIRMPERNGYEVFRASKEMHPTTEVILMTGFGYDPHHSIVRSSQEGLHSFLFKPFKAAQMIDEVTKAILAAKKA